MADLIKSRFKKIEAQHKFNSNSHFGMTALWERLSSRDPSMQIETESLSHKYCPLQAEQLQHDYMSHSYLFVSMTMEGVK